MKFFNEPNCLLAITRFANYFLLLAFQQGPQTLTYDRVIVGDDNV